MKFNSGQRLNRVLTVVSLIFGLSVLQGCVQQPVQPSPAFLRAAPQSILILPPTNLSNEAEAPYIYLSTISEPFGEQGYYVFPVMVVDAFMKGNGMHLPAEMHKVPLDKLSEVFGQDAVLYINIESFGQEYVLLSSNTVVRATARLVESKTGTVIWQGKAVFSEGSGDGGGGVAGMLVAALVDQIVDSLSERVRDVSIVANDMMVRSLPAGPYLVAQQALEGQEAK